MTSLFGFTYSTNQKAAIDQTLENNLGEDLRKDLKFQ